MYAIKPEGGERKVKAACKALSAVEVIRPNHTYKQQRQKVIDPSLVQKAIYMEKTAPLPPERPLFLASHLTKTNIV